MKPSETPAFQRPCPALEPPRAASTTAAWEAEGKQAQQGQRLPTERASRAGSEVAVAGRNLLQVGPCSCRICARCMPGLGNALTQHALEVARVVRLWQNRPRAAGAGQTGATPRSAWPPRINQGPAAGGARCRRGRSSFVGGDRSAGAGFVSRPRRGRCTPIDGAHGHVKEPGVAAGKEVRKKPVSPLASLGFARLKASVVRNRSSMDRAEGVRHQLGVGPMRPGAPGKPVPVDQAARSSTDKWGSNLGTVSRATTAGPANSVGARVVAPRPGACAPAWRLPARNGRRRGARMKSHRGRSPSAGGFAADLERGSRRRHQPWASGTGTPRAVTGAAPGAGEGSCSRVRRSNRSAQSARRRSRGK